jgi:hypothetical protein
MGKEKETESTKKHPIQKLMGVIAKILKKILVVIVWNPIIGFVLAAVIFGRLYEFGYLRLEGSTVMVTGQCTTENGDLRSDLIQDQVLVSSLTEDSIEGVLRLTREYIRCEIDKVSIDSLGSIFDLDNPLVEIPTIKKHISKDTKKKRLEKMYLKKTLIVSGTCLDINSKKELKPFSKKRIAITAIKQTRNTRELIFYGVREDNVAVACKEEAITFQLEEDVDATSVNEVEVPVIKKDYKGKVVLVSGYCFPNEKFYNKLKSKGVKVKALNSFYNLVNTPIEVEANKFKKGNPVYLSGTIMDKANPKAFGSKIECKDDFPFKVKEVDHDYLKKLNKKKENKNE